MTYDEWMPKVKKDAEITRRLRTELHDAKVEIAVVKQEAIEATNKLRDDYENQITSLKEQISHIQQSIPGPTSSSIYYKCELNPAYKKETSRAGEAALAYARDKLGPDCDDTADEILDTKASFFAGASWILAQADKAKQNVRLPVWHKTVSTCGYVEKEWIDIVQYSRLENLFT
jgi:hypothetical protein